MKGLDDGPDGLNDAAFDRALGVPKTKRKATKLIGYELRKYQSMGPARWQAIRLSDGMPLRGRDGGSFRTKALAKRAAELDADKSVQP